MAGNWTPATVPDGGADVTFGSAGSTATVDATSRVVGTVLFNRAATFTVNNSGGATLTINTAINAGTQNQSYTISAPVVLGGANSWSVTQNQVTLSGG